jgi:hypothetical protein
MMNGVHVEPSMNGGIINSITRLHLVGYFSWVILWYTDPWILVLNALLIFVYLLALSIKLFGLAVP